MLFCRNYSLFHQKQFGANYNFPAIGSFTKPVVKSAALSESVSALIGSKAWKQDQINLAFFNSITAIDRFGNSEFSGFKCGKIFISTASIVPSPVILGTQSRLPSFIAFKINSFVSGSFPIEAKTNTVSAFFHSFEARTKSEIFSPHSTNFWEVCRLLFFCTFLEVQSCSSHYHLWKDYNINVNI